MRKKTVKLGVAGLRRGRTVVSELIGDKTVEIRAIADIDEERRLACKEDFESRGVTNLLVYDSLEDMLEKADIDAVFIATDKPSHVKHTVAALNAGKHVLCEIPTVSTVEEAKELKNAVRTHPELKYMVAENCFYWAFIESWKKMYEDGKFGDVVYAEAEYFHSAYPSKIHPAKPKSSHWRVYNHAIEYLTHSLGPLLYIMGDRCVSVTCMEPEENKYNPAHLGKEVGVALFRTAKGAIIRILISFGTYAGFDHNFAIYGTKGSIMTDKSKPFDEATCFAKLSEIPDTFDRAFEIPISSRYAGETAEGSFGGIDRKMIRDFIRCIREDTPPPIDVDMGLRISIPGLIAHEAAKAEKTLSILEVD